MQNKIILKSLLICGLVTCLAIMVNPSFSSITQKGLPEDQLHLGALFSLVLIITVTNISMGRFLFSKEKITPKSLLAILFNILLAIPIAVMAIVVSVILACIVTLPFVVFTMICSAIAMEFSNFNMDNIASYITFFIVLSSFVCSYATVTYLMALKVFNTIEEKEPIKYENIIILTSIMALVIMITLNFAENFPHWNMGIPLAGLLGSIPVLFHQAR